MSAKKSFDVARKGRAPVAVPEPAPPKRRRRVRMPKAPLKERRRQARKRLLVSLLVVLVLIVVLFFVGIWQAPVRISSVEAAGQTQDALVAIAKRELSGTYAFVIPRNSIFFFPEDGIRQALLTEHPEIAAVSITRTSFTSLRIAPVGRTAAFLWCGTERTEEPTCYEADAEGLVFTRVPYERATQPGELKIYGALAEGGDSPIGSRVASAERIPEALRFVKMIRGLGASVETLHLRADEGNVYLESGTRITYVLGKEESAAALAAASFPTLSLTDGSIEYIDLRFDKKIYVKRFGQAEE